MTKQEVVFQSNREKIIDFFQRNPTKIYSLLDLQKELGLAPQTIRKHLNLLIQDNSIREVRSNPTLHLFQYKANRPQIPKTPYLSDTDPDPDIIPGPDEL